jgi:hypothetical protein
MVDLLGVDLVVKDEFQRQIIGQPADFSKEVISLFL